MIVYISSLKLYFDFSNVGCAFIEWLPCNPDFKLAGLVVIVTVVY